MPLVQTNQETVDREKKRQKIHRIAIQAPAEIIDDHLDSGNATMSSAGVHAISSFSNTPRELPAALPKVCRRFGAWTMRPTVRPVSMRRPPTGVRALLGAYAAAKSFSDTKVLEKAPRSNGTTISLASCHSLLKTAFPALAVLSGRSEMEWSASWLKMALMVVDLE